MDFLNPISVFVDHRETNARVKNALQRNSRVLLEVSTLKTGDYKIGDILLVERKTIRDFAISIVQGRIFRQAVRLTRAVEEGGIICSLIALEGHEGEFDKTGVSRESIQGTLSSLMIKFGLPVFRTYTPEDTVSTMMIVYNQLEKEGRYSGNISPIRSRKYTGKNLKRKKSFILQGFPGIGPERSEALLEEFGTVRKVFTASETELTEVEGIGSGTAKKICSLLD